MEYIKSTVVKKTIRDEGFKIGSSVVPALNQVVEKILRTACKKAKVQGRPILKGEHIFEVCKQMK